MSFYFQCTNTLYTQTQSHRTHETANSPSNTPHDSIFQRDGQFLGERRDSHDQGPVLRVRPAHLPGLPDPPAALGETQGLAAYQGQGGRSRRHHHHLPQCRPNRQDALHPCAPKDRDARGDAQVGGERARQQALPRHPPDLRRGG